MITVKETPIVGAYKGGEVISKIYQGDNPVYQKEATDHCYIITCNNVLKVNASGDVTATFDLGMIHLASGKFDNVIAVLGTSDAKFTGAAIKLYDLEFNLIDSIDIGDFAPSGLSVSTTQASVWYGKNRAMISVYGYGYCYINFNTRGVYKISNENPGSACRKYPLTYDKATDAFYSPGVELLRLNEDKKTWNLVDTENGHPMFLNPCNGQAYQHTNMIDYDNYIVNPCLGGVVRISNRVVTTFPYPEATNTFYSLLVKKGSTIWAFCRHNGAFGRVSDLDNGTVEYINNFGGYTRYSIFSGLGVCEKSGKFITSVYNTANSSIRIYVADIATGKVEADYKVVSVTNAVNGVGVTGNAPMLNSIINVN